MNTTAPYPSIAAIGSRIDLLIAGHIDLAFRRIMPGPGVEIAPRFIRLITGEPHPFGNFACCNHPVDAATTRAAIEPLLRCSAPAAVFFTGPVPDPVVKVLADAGFERHGGMPTMAIDIDTLAATALPDGHTIERVSDAAQRDTWADAFARGYELPARVGAAFAGGIDGDDRTDAPVQCFWILHKGEPVATSFVYLHEGVAGIYGVATLPDHRGKGLGAHATAHPLRIAHQLGYRVGILQASEVGAPVYTRIGFSTFGEIPLYVRMPG